MRNIKQFFTKQSLRYLISIPRVFVVLKNAIPYIQSYISGNNSLTHLYLRNGYTYPIKNFDDLGVFYEIFIQREYGKISKNDKNIIDIGANNGLFMLYCKYNQPQSVIHCFEPVPQCVKNIKDIIEMNHLKDVFVHEIAISNHEGETSLYLEDQTIAATLHKNIAGGTHTLTVKTSTLPLQASRNHISHIDILKMDCEGSEYEIIDSLSAEFINACDNIMIEWHNIDHDKTGKILYNQCVLKSTHTHKIYKKHGGHGNNGFIKLYK